MADDVAASRTIRRLSTLYVPQQDRMRLTAELNDGDVQLLWLTQRLLRLALAPLATHFESKPGPTLEQKARRTTANLLEKVSGKGGVALSTLDVQEEWLVESLEIGFGKTVHFTFKGGGERALHMDMDPLHLRQWLGILRRKCRRAGWPDSLWPAPVVAGLD